MTKSARPNSRSGFGAIAEVPVLGVALTQGMISGEGTARRNRLFQRALSAKIDMFDLTASATPLLDLRLIGEANRKSNRSLTLILPVRPRSSQPPLQPASLPTTGPTELEQTSAGDPPFVSAVGTALGPKGSLWVELPVDDAESSATSDASTALPSVPEGTTATWVVRWDSPAQLDSALRQASRLGGAVVSGPASLLDPRGPAAVAAVSPAGTRRYLARDPFAGGRLDGSLLEVGNLDRNPNEGPWSLERLQVEYGPVLAFGFLSKRGVRNLRVAALQYLLTLPSVAGIVVPIATERQIEELERLPSAPPLETEELDRITQLQTGRRAS
ncbi:MAG: hypothetical protein WB782_09035 [Thermoplasmata archaeon]